MDEVTGINIIDLEYSKIIHQILWTISNRQVFKQKINTQCVQTERLYNIIQYQFKLTKQYNLHHCEK